ncbi:hypothetical protein FVEG_16754 [Fusarium verticillioides 7600]|uniref:Uncharacterized protein n=1 Tax=Gibberella moniliformis (strain M3125 / FGSC 7600) TaxID=334819 RepID=W7MJB8_GIBM7|nr:hypothetical protein FVEG_16754 [Fusarium verticillioides 7600]XP_018757302.1 hypothetical protein FVEG_16754 [Fusarium verticillioides 7600]EWG51110.1 hypothetical protein FVEG_16754 [Fusarium verticillioides 7600]EWG51111.1 hypothetical protein FVEG_16754 [Fusarium verticillioides 7600]
MKGWKYVLLASSSRTSMITYPVHQLLRLPHLPPPPQHPRPLRFALLRLRWRRTYSHVVSQSSSPKFNHQQHASIAKSHNSKQYQMQGETQCDRKIPQLTRGNGFNREIIRIALDRILRWHATSALRAHLGRSRNE